jgi:acetylornithine aminotransferase
VSPEIIADRPIATPTTGEPFNIGEFQSYVMDTYGRFPIAIAKGLMAF